LFSQSRTRLALLATVLGAVALATTWVVAPPQATPAAAAETLAPSPALEAGTEVRLGVTHAQHSLDAWHDASAVASGRRLLQAVPGTFQNQHLMGWGTLNPEPSPGVYDWRSLDKRMKLARDTGGTPVITLCCSPDWMKGGKAGTTDWSKLEVAPKPEHYDDFARLAAETARRYPDVLHFQVWNEMKGFWSSTLNRWSYEAYTDLYNQVYVALKEVNPAIQVGGPYVVMASWKNNIGGGRTSAVQGPWGMVDQRALDVVSYWLEHAVGAEFLTVDASTVVTNVGYLVSPEESLAKFAAVDDWLRARTDLPIWWSEFKPVPAFGSHHFTPEREAAIWTASMKVLEESGAAVALLWQPQGATNHTGLWTDVSKVGGGQPTRLYDALTPWLH
jgi:hypothetical protein